MIFPPGAAFVTPSENPNGIPSQSPGPPSANHFQPQRSCGHSRPSIARDIRHNHVAVALERAVNGASPSVFQQAH